MESRKLTLEDYLNLEHLDVIVPSTLQKIISIHGFKANKIPKNDLLDAVRSIELMDARRSTLQSDSVSSQAFLSLKDVIKDLSVLQWQECCITSIQTINSVVDFSSGVEPTSTKRLKLNGNFASSSKDEATASSIAIHSGFVGDDHGGPKNTPRSREKIIKR